MARLKRKIDQLKEAKYCKSPFPPRKTLGRGAKAAGIRYERRVREEFAERGLLFSHGLWIQFTDQNGNGFAQPDFTVYTDAENWVLVEAKLSQTESAFTQLTNLYLPLMQFIHPRVNFTCIQVCKHLRYPGADIIEDFRNHRCGATWHWLD